MYEQKFSEQNLADAISLLWAVKEENLEAVKKSVKNSNISKWPDYYKSVILFNASQIGRNDKHFDKKTNILRYLLEQQAINRCLNEDVLEFTRQHHTSDDKQSKAILQIASNWLQKINESLKEKTPFDQYITFDTCFYLKPFIRELLNDAIGKCEKGLDIVEFYIESEKDKREEEMPFICLERILMGTLETQKLSVVNFWLDEKQTIISSNIIKEKHWFLNTFLLNAVKTKEENLINACFENKTIKSNLPKLISGYFLSEILKCEKGINTICILYQNEEIKSAISKFDSDNKNVFRETLIAFEEQGSNFEQKEIIKNLKDLCLKKKQISL